MDHSEVDLLAIENDSHSLDMSAIYSMALSQDTKPAFFDDDDDEDDDDDDDDSRCSDERFNKSTETEDHPNDKEGGKTRYKHVPHREKPVQVVARRNARERRRVQTVNSAFCSLRKHIPYENRHKRLSKVKTLRIAIDYINELQSMLHNHDTLLDGLVGGNHVAPLDLLHGSLNTGHGHQQTMSSMQTMPSLPLTTDTAVMTSFPNPANSIPTTLFTGTGSLLDLMTSSSMHQHLQSQTLDWSGQAKELHDFLQVTAE